MIAEYMNEHEMETFGSVAKELELDEKAVREMCGMYDFSTDISKEDVEGFQRTADFMYENGMIEKKVDVKRLFY